MANPWETPVVLNNSGAQVTNIAASTDAQVFAVGAFNKPAVVWVRPAGGTWTVEYSVDNGANYQALTGLTGATGYSEVVAEAGFTNLRITSTSTAGGTWGIA